MGLEKVTSETGMMVRLREEIPLSHLTPEFFRFRGHYDMFLKGLAKGKESVFVFILADGESGEVRVAGVSEKPNGYETGEAYDGMGYGTIPFVVERFGSIKALLPSYAPAKDNLYAIAKSPTSDKIVADSRDQV